MNENGNIYYQLLTGPDGEPLVVLRARDLAALIGANPDEAAFSRGADMAHGLRPASADERRRWSKVATALAMHTGSGTGMQAAGFADDTDPFYLLGNASIDGDSDDETAYRAIKSQLSASAEEIVPGPVADQLLEGANPVAVWREYRGMTQKELASEAGLSQAMISQIETRKRTGDVETLRCIANVLGVILDDLVA